jgi:hypothetical protein
MQKRRRFGQGRSLEKRLAAEAMPFGLDRSHMSELPTSLGLRTPE